MNWADSKMCVARQKKVRRNTDCTIATNGKRETDKIPDVVRSCEMKTKSSEEMAELVVPYPDFGKILDK